VVTTAKVLGIRNAELMYTRGAVASQGGFFFYARGMDVWTNGVVFFAGCILQQLLLVQTHQH
jgi:hypothetical protein